MQKKEKKKASRDVITIQIARLITAFPMMKSENFFVELAKRIEANNFTEYTLVRAVDYVIDHVDTYQLSVASVMKAKQVIEDYEANRFELHPALRDEY